MCCMLERVNPFPHTTILQQTTLNIFCLKTENLYNWMDNLWLKVENIVANGEIARFVQILLLSLCFQIAVCCRGVRKRLKCQHSTSETLSPTYFVFLSISEIMCNDYIKGGVINDTCSLKLGAVCEYVCDFRLKPNPNLQNITCAGQGEWSHGELFNDLVCTGNKFIVSAQIFIWSRQV